MLIKILIFSTILGSLLELKTEAFKSENIKNEFIKNVKNNEISRVVRSANNISQKPSFNGSSWLELDRNTIANASRQLASGIALLFSTKQSNGLLLWYGQNKGHEFNGEDFLSLAIKDGVLELAFRLDGEESFIRHHGTRVDQNFRHIAIIKRQGNQAILELDGLTEYGETRQTLKKEMDLPGHIFLGGAPDMRRFTGDRHTQGFIGCIHVVEPIAGGPIRLGEKTISSMNIEQCSVADEVDEDSSETE